MSRQAETFSEMLGYVFLAVLTVCAVALMAGGTYYVFREHILPKPPATAPACKPPPG